MSPRSLVTVVLALGFGLSAAFGVTRMTRGGGTAAVETVGVVVAQADIDRFSTLTAEMLAVKQYPKDLAPPGSASHVEELVGRVLETNLVKDEAVLESKLAPPGAGRGMAAVIPVGMRAVTIHTPNIASGVAGFILPGNKVDVMFNQKIHQQNDDTGGGITRTIIENVEILAVDQQIAAPSENKVDAKELKSVTLLVSPRDAAKIDLAQNVGTLHLTLRNPLDTNPATSGRATLKGIDTGHEGTPLDERFAGVMEQGSKWLGGLFTAAPRSKPGPPAVAEAPPPTPVPEKPAVPEPLPRVRTLRGGIPGHVFIE